MGDTTQAEGTSATGGAAGGPAATGSGEQRPGSTAPAGAAPGEGSILKGLGLLLLLHLLQVPGLVIAAPAWIGVSQLFYVVPAAIWLNRRGEALTQRGLLIGAAVTFLLNATCWGWVSFGGGSFH